MPSRSLAGFKATLDRAIHLFPAETFAQAQHPATQISLQIPQGPAPNPLRYFHLDATLGTKGSVKVLVKHEKMA